MRPWFGGTSIAVVALGLIPWAANAQNPNSARAAALRGAVYDSVHHVPVADATVLAIKGDAGGTPSITQARTDARGAFEFKSLTAGRYTISVESAALDSAGLAIPDIERTLDAGIVLQLSLATPSRATRVRLACGGALTDTTLGAIVGVVRDVTTGRPLPRALLVLQWSDFNVDSAARYHPKAKQASVTTDSSGAFRACGVPAQRSVFLQAQWGPSNSGIVQQQINETGVLARDLALPADSTLRGYGDESVTVLDADGHPIPSAQVRLVGTTRSVAVRNDGRARVDSLPLGTQQLEAIAVGYYPERRDIDVDGRVHGSVTVTMEKLATVLASMRIVANANNPKYREFEERRKQGWGDFYTEDDIAKRQVFDLSDFFMVLRHVDAHVSVTGHHYFTMMGQTFHGISTIMAGPVEPVGGVLAGRDSTLARDYTKSPVAGFGTPGAGSGACQPAVFVNGTLQGGDEYSGDALDVIPARFVHAIEVYDAKFNPVPIQYRNPGNCGAILIWTK